MIFVPSEDSDQPGYLQSLIKVFVVCLKKARIPGYPVNVDAQAELWHMFYTLMSSQNIKHMEPNFWAAKTLQLLINRNLPTYHFYCPALVVYLGGALLQDLWCHSPQCPVEVPQYGR